MSNEKTVSLEEAAQVARRFVMEQKYKIYCPGPENRSRRENFRQTRERLLDGGGVTTSLITKVMVIKGFEIIFKKK